MTGRLITVDDISSFDPNAEVCLEELEDIISRSFKQPEEGLGFENCPVAHMWRTMIWPKKYLSLADQPAGQRPRVGLGTGFTAGGLERRTSEGGVSASDTPPRRADLGRAHRLSVSRHRPSSSGIPWSTPDSRRPA